MFRINDCGGLILFFYMLYDILAGGRYVSARKFHSTCAICDEKKLTHYNNHSATNGSIIKIVDVFQIVSIKNSGQAAYLNQRMFWISPYIIKLFSMETKNNQKYTAMHQCFYC